MKLLLSISISLSLAACGGSAKHEGTTPTSAPSSSSAAMNVPPPAPVDPEVKKMTDLAGDDSYAKTYPQADAVVAYDRDDITLGKDGTVTLHHRWVVKILDAQRGKEKFADVHIPFDAKTDTLKIDRARTVNANGKVAIAEPEEIEDIIPPRLSGATTYSTVKERVISFPAVDKNSVVELEYTKTMPASPDSALGGEAFLGMWNPIVSRIVSITAPADVTPKFEVENAQLKPTESSDAAAGTHTWTFSESNLPDQQPEDGSPAEETLLPRLVYGFQPDWNAVLAKIADRYLDAAVPKVLPAAVKTQADKLVAGAKTDGDKALAIYRFVAHEIHTVDVPLAWVGLQPNGPDVVLANRYGDTRDKVGLFLALCAAEKIDGQPVLVRSWHVPVIAAVPTLAQFDRMIAKLSLGGKDVWVDPSDEDGELGVMLEAQDNLVLELKRGGGQLVPHGLADPTTSTSHIAEAYVLDDKGNLDARYKFDATGTYAATAMATLRPLKGELLSQFFQQSASTVGAGALDVKHDISDLMAVSGPVTISHHVTVPEYAPAQGNFRVFELPGPTLGFMTDVPVPGLAQRKYPLWIGTPRTFSEDISVTLPSGWKVAYVPPELKGTADGLAYGSSCATKGQTLTCHGELKLTALQISADKYQSYHDAMNKLMAYEQRIVLLTR